MFSEPVLVRALAGGAHREVLRAVEVVAAVGAAAAGPLGDGGGGRRGCRRPSTSSAANRTSWRRLWLVRRGPGCTSARGCRGRASTGRRRRGRCGPCRRGTVSACRVSPQVRRRAPVARRKFPCPAGGWEVRGRSAEGWRPGGRLRSGVSAVVPVDLLADVVALVGQDLFGIGAGTVVGAVEQAAEGLPERLFRVVADLLGAVEFRFSGGQGGGDVIPTGAEPLADGVVLRAGTGRPALPGIDSRPRRAIRMHRCAAATARPPARTRPRQRHHRRSSPPTGDAFDRP